MQIAGLQKITLVDYPGVIAATIFTRGCSFRCPFCHNPELVLPDQFSPLMDEDEIIDFFASRVGKLQGICITGGEPLLQSDINGFIKKIKELGLKVKLDTNGSFPDKLEELIKEGNLDYIAMDIKTSPGKYPSLVFDNFQFSPLRSSNFTGQAISDKGSNAKMINDTINDQCKMSSTLRDEPSGSDSNEKNDKLIRDISKSIELIMNSGIDYEFRTTVCHPLHEVSAFEGIGQLIKGARLFNIQNFVASKHVDSHTKFKPFTDLELEQAQKIVKKYVPESCIR